MKFKYIQVVALLLLFFIGGVRCALAQTTFTYEMLYYTVISESQRTVAVTGHVNGTSAAGMLTIPSCAYDNGNNRYYVVRIENNAFKDTHFLGDLIIPNTVTEIGSGAFWNATFNGILTIGASVYDIGGNAFRGCQFTEVESLAMTPPSIFASTTFYQCPATTLTVPMTTVSTYQISFWADAFSNIVEGKMIVVNDVIYALNNDNTTMSATRHKIDIMATGALTLMPSITANGHIYNVTKISGHAFYGCDGLTGDIVIPNSVTTIQPYAFYDCVGFSGELVLPNSVTDIGYNAFYNCENLTGELIIPDGITEINQWVFYGCSSLSSVQFPNSLTYIGEYAFAGCSGLTGDLIIGSSITTIKNDAFNSCFGLNGNLVLPETIRVINDNAFAYCTNLSSVIILATEPPMVGWTAFYLVHCGLVVPCGCLTAYINWMQWFYENITEDCSAVEDVKASTVNVYPNPSDGIVKISAESLKNVEIYNMTGQKVFETEVSGNEFEYDFGGSTGIYLFKVETAKGIETQRVVVK